MGVGCDEEGAGEVDTFIKWDRDKLKRLKKTHTEVFKKGEVVFMFEGHEFDTGYAKYLIEWLEGKFK